MDIGINDLSFRFAFSSEQQALAAVEEFVDICKELEKPKCTNVDRLLSVRIDTTCEVAPNCKLIQLIQKLSLPVKSVSNLLRVAPFVTYTLS